MRVFLAVLVLIFSLQSWTKADDISDFEIEGMSVGDSLLDYFNEEEIKKFETTNYKIPEKNKFKRIYIINNNFENYEYLSVDTKYNDNKYKIYGLTGMIDYNDVKDCFLKQNDIFKDLKKVFSQKPEKSIIPSDYDKTGKSKMHYITYELDDGLVHNVCYDFAEHTNIQSGLDISIRLNEFQDWLNSD